MTKWHAVTSIDTDCYEAPTVERVEFERDLTIVMGNCTHWKIPGQGKGTSDQL